MALSYLLFTVHLALSLSCEMSFTDSAGLSRVEFRRYPTSKFHLKSPRSFIQASTYLPLFWLLTKGWAKRAKKANANYCNFDIVYYVLAGISTLYIHSG